jgi:cysteine synthase A
MSLMARAHGASFTAVIDPKTSIENVAKMEIFGAEIDLVEECDEYGSYLESRLRRVRERCNADSALVWTDQYGNRANPAIHCATTGPELVRQMDGRIDAAFVATSTCGTLTGIARHLRDRCPDTRIIAVDSEGSAVFGDPPARRQLVGIGSSLRPRFDVSSAYDAVIHVGAAAAFGCCRALQATAGLWVGGSSGAVIAACLQYMRVHEEVTRVVCVCPDTGTNYGTTIWNDEWLDRQGVVLDPDLASLRYGRAAS